MTDRYIKCKLTLDTEGEYLFLLGVVRRETGCFSASQEHRDHANAILEALEAHTNP